MPTLFFVALITQPGSAPNPTQPPVQPPRRLREGSISNADYPAEAIRAGASGTTVAAVDIAADGRVTGCRASQSAGHPSLDAKTCEIITTRFRFEPGPAASSRSLRIAWRLPDGLDAPDFAPVPFASSRVIVRTSYPETGPAFCQRFVEGRPPEQVGSMRCAPNATAPRMPSVVTRRLTSLQEFIANGQPLPANPTVGEERHEHSRLRIEVDQRGIVVGCGPKAADDEVLTSSPLTRVRCEGMMSGARIIFEPSASPGTREGLFVESSVINTD